jgi:RNA 3'-phosphate cyclase
LSAIEIDGSHGEGGGQLLRMSIALSAITGKAVKITNIRAKRRNPGLAAQHVVAIDSIVKLCNGEIRGLNKGSMEVDFHPSKISGGDLKLEVGTAGSLMLVLQASLPPSLLASNPVNLSITGGTDVRWAPPFDYFQNVFLPMIAIMGAKTNLELERRGYYPRGGGKIEMKIQPSGKLSPLNVSDRGQLKRVSGLAHVSNLPISIAERMKSEAEKILLEQGDVAIDTMHYESPKAIGQGGALVLWAEFENTVIGASCLAEKGLKSEKVAQIASQELKLDMDAEASLDVHCADQVLPYMALADAPSEFTVRKVSNHSKTNIWLIEQFLDVSFSVEKSGDLWKVRSRRG